MTRNLKRKTDLYYTTEGTYNKMQNEGDKANQERALECDIKSVIEKYGIMPIELLNKAKEPLFIDNLELEGNLNERIQQRNKIDDYFDTLPAAVRKKFGDNKNTFYTKLITGNYEEMLDSGILEKAQTEQLEQKRLAKTNRIKELEQNILNLQGELTNAKQQISEISKNSEDIYPSNPVTD